VVAAQSEGEVE
jgi:hypothetical protein